MVLGSILQVSSSTASPTERAVRETQPASPRPPRLLDRVRNALRARHGSRCTEKAYIAWIRRYILFHKKRHPAEMGAAEVTQFLSWLAVEKNEAPSAMNARRVSRFALIIGVAALLTACASMHGLTCKNGEQLVILDSLYFGTDKRNGVVTPEEWAEFLKSTVTPRFPQGFTVSLASGQWRGADGAIVREASHVLQLARPDDAPSEKAVLEVVATYKAQFQQEALLRVKARACVSF